MPVALAKITAAQQILNTLQQMGQRQSNPVLEVLSGKTPELEQKYPKNELRFAEGGWRGFYHCHDAPGKDPAEHGHFHLFAHCGPGDDSKRDWCHVAALVMDFEGQPLAWTATNQWVTSGVWLQADKLAPYLEQVEVALKPELSLVESWLLSMLILYQNDIRNLLQRRDSELMQIKPDAEANAILQDRQIYILATSPIAFTAMLQRVLSEPGTDQEVMP